MTEEYRKDYLKRINYVGELTPSLEVLKHLQKFHLLHVPFENLDIHTDKKIELENTYDKVVRRNRGGFCYEVNGLFFELLKDIGFEVILISARTYEADKGFGPEFDHMAIIATLNGLEYLTDVGFGEFTFAPLKIELNTIQPDQRGIFKIENHEDDYLVVKKQSGDQFIPQYMFKEKAREINEFSEMLLYHQTSPLSHFTKKRLCSLPTENGRVTVAGNTLKITENGAIKETQLKNEEEFYDVLWEYFKVKL